MSSPLNFHLEQYDGPLDLLLDLIRKQEINIYDIPIARITQQYLEYMQTTYSAHVRPVIGIGSRMTIRDLLDQGADAFGLLKRVFDDLLQAGVSAESLAAVHAPVGIDIGSLDAVIMAGYPGSIASSWQRAGRA